MLYAVCVCVCVFIYIYLMLHFFRTRTMILKKKRNEQISLILQKELKKKAHKTMFGPHQQYFFNRTSHNTQYDFHLVINIRLYIEKHT